MTEKHAYQLNTGLSGYYDRKKKFSTDKEAWNFLAKRFDAVYKTGGHVIAHLEKFDVPIYNIHEKQGLETTFSSTKVSVAVGYVCYDWDGVPWNNPTNCQLCGEPIPSKRYRDVGYCDTCKEIMDSLDNAKDYKGNLRVTRKLVVPERLVDIIKAKGSDARIRSMNTHIRQGRWIIKPRDRFETLELTGN